MLEKLGDEASNHLVERFVQGEIYHVEGITWEGEVLWASAHKYGSPPMQTMHHGGVFTTRTLERDGEEARQLLKIHKKTINALGMTSGVTHSEFIRAKADGKFYFLETAARVGGAFIAEVSEFASGVNRGWSGRGLKSRQCVERPTGCRSCVRSMRERDLSSEAGDAGPEWVRRAEVVHRMSKHHHAGLIVRSTKAERVRVLLESMGRVF